MSEETKQETAEEEKTLESLTADYKALVEKSEIQAKKLAESEAEKAKVVVAATSKVTGNRSNSDESRCLKYFGVRSPAQLLHINTGSSKYNHVPGELKGMARQFKEDFDVARWTAQIYKGGKRDILSGDHDIIPSVPEIRDTHFYKEVLAPQLKSFDSTTGGAGDEWVPTNLSSSFIEEFELERQVEGAFRSLTMTSQPWELPVQTDVTEAKAVAEGAAATDDNFGTDKLTFNATKFQEFYIMPEELNEDSAPQILSLARSEVVEAQQRAQEQAILNGDTAGTHQDSDTDGGAANLAAKQYDGLRKLAIANSANGGTETFASGITAAKLRTMIKNAGKFGVRPRDMVWFVSPCGYQQMVGLEEVYTVDKFGQAATVLSGALAIFQGMPIMISEFMRDDLNVSGVHDGVTEDNTGILLVNHRRFYMGLRRPIRVRVLQDPRLEYDRWLLASYSRKDFQGHAQSASETSVVYGVDITA